MITLNTRCVRYVGDWCSLMIGGDVITISCVEMAMKVEGQSICHKLLLKHEDMISHYFLVTFIYLQENCAYGERNVLLRKLLLSFILPTAYYITKYWFGSYDS